MKPKIVKLGNRKNKKLRLTYHIEYLSDTEIRFSVSYTDKEGANYCECINGWNVSVYASDVRSELWRSWSGPSSGIVFVAGKEGDSTVFKSKQERDYCIKLAT